MPEPVESFETWFLRFQEEYLRRTAMTWRDGCGELEPVLDYHAAGVTPLEAVLDQIAAHGLIDSTDSPWLATTQAKPTPLETSPPG